MKYTLFNWTEMSHALTLSHRRKVKTHTTPLPSKTIKSQQHGWRQLLDLCGDCFIRY